MTDFITMAHGNGGATMQELIRDYFVEAFDNPILSQGEDQARIALQEMNALGGTLAFSTDSFVIFVLWLYFGRRLTTGNLKKIDPIDGKSLPFSRYSSSNGRYQSGTKRCNR